MPHGNAFYEPLRRLSLVLRVMSPLLDITAVVWLLTSGATSDLALALALLVCYGYVIAILWRGYRMVRETPGYPQVTSADLIALKRKLFVSFGANDWASLILMLFVCLLIAARLIDDDRADVVFFGVIYVCAHVLHLSVFWSMKRLEDINAQRINA